MRVLIMNYILEGFEQMKANAPTTSDKPAIGTPIIVDFPRNRLNSMNAYTPQLTPLRFIQSPFMGEGNFFESQLNLQGDFKLQEAACEEHFSKEEESEEESVSQMEFPFFGAETRVTKENMIEFLVDATNVAEDRIQEVRQGFQKSGQTFIAEVFQYLYKRFKKSKKTKEQMIKYTMRKSFKFITDQMKREDPSLIPLLSTDGLEGMSIYFTKHSEDQQISIPFKKNSLEKTMNTAFLKKVFSCERFYKDYRRFLKTFQNQFLKDNKKKTSSMTDAVRVCINSKSYKSLENYKRLPWTKDILLKLKKFAHDLLTHSPLKDPEHRLARDVARWEHVESKHQRFDINDHELLPNPHIRGRSGQFRYEDDDEEEIDNSKKAYPKKQVIILTPPLLSLNSPKITEPLELED